MVEAHNDFSWDKLSLNVGGKPIPVKNPNGVVINIVYDHAKIIEKYHNISGESPCKITYFQGKNDLVRIITKNGKWKLYFWWKNKYKNIVTKKEGYHMSNAKINASLSKKAIERIFCKLSNILEYSDITKIMNMEEYNKYKKKFELKNGFPMNHGL